MTTRNYAIIAVLALVIYIPFVASGAAEKVATPKTVFTPLEVGSRVRVTEDKFGRYEIEFLGEQPAQKYPFADHALKVAEVGNDYIVINDNREKKQLRISVHNVKVITVDLLNRPHW